MQEARPDKLRLPDLKKRQTLKKLALLVLGGLFPQSLLGIGRTGRDGALDFAYDEVFEVPKTLDEFLLGKHLSFRNLRWYLNLEGATQHWLKLVVYEYARLYEKIYSHKNKKVNKPLRKVINQFFNIMRGFAPLGFELSGDPIEGKTTSTANIFDEGGVSATTSYENGDVPRIVFRDKSVKDKLGYGSGNSIGGWEAYKDVAFLKHSTLFAKFIHEFAHIVYTRMSDEIGFAKTGDPQYMKFQNENLQKMLPELTEDVRIDSDKKESLQVIMRYNYMPYPEAVTHRVVAPVLLMFTLFNNTGELTPKKDAIRDLIFEFITFAGKFARESGDTVFARCAIGSTMPYVVASVIFKNSLTFKESAKQQAYKYAKFVMPAVEKFYKEFYPEDYYRGPLIFPVFKIFTENHSVLTDPLLREINQIVNLAYIIKEAERRGLAIAPEMQEEKNRIRNILVTPGGSLIGDLLPIEIQWVFGW